MQLQDFKRWHWAIIGLLIGLVLSYAFSDHDVATDAAWKDKEIKQAAFEREAFSRSHESHEPLLQNVVVEPPVLDYLKHAKQIVRGDRLRYSEKYKREYRDSFFYYADNPYTPITVPIGSDPAAVKNVKTVMDFLAFAQQTIGPAAVAANARPWEAALPIRYRFAWEYESRWNVVLWATGGLVVIGGIWPTFVNLLVGAGFGAASKPKSTEEAEYLSRFGNGKADQAAATKIVGDADGERRRLDEFNAALASGLSPTGSHVTSETESAVPDVAPVRSLVTDPVPATGSEAEPESQLSDEERRKQYAGGDFYPVARGAKKS